MHFSYGIEACRPASYSPSYPLGLRSEGYNTCFLGDFYLFTRCGSYYDVLRKIRCRYRNLGKFGFGKHPDFHNHDAADNYIGAVYFVNIKPRGLTSGFDFIYFLFRLYRMALFGKQSS